MELESLRQVWHTIEIPSLPGQDALQLLSLVKKRSLSPVARMKRNIVKELILVIAVYTPGILYYVFEFDGKLSEISWLLFFLLLLFAGYFYKKYTLLKGMQCISCQVRSNMERQVHALKRYIRFYTVAGTAMIPLILVSAFLIIRWKLPPTPGAALYYKMGGLPWWQSSITWLLALIPATIVAYYINVWYVNKLYGRHIRKLEEMLQELLD
jgi:hypothetical protein